MDSDNQNEIFCADDDEYGIYSDIRDNFSIDRYYKTHLKSKTQTNNIRKRTFR